MAENETVQEQGLQEHRIFNPSSAFAANAAVSGMAAYDKLCAEAEADYEGFWARLARESLSWHKPFTKVLDESNAPFFTWFEDGELIFDYQLRAGLVRTSNAIALMRSIGLDV